MVTPPWTGERPRAPGVSGGQSRQAPTRGSAQSRMQTCSLRRTSQEPGRPLGELPSLGEGSLRPQPRVHATKDAGKAGLFPSRRASSTACPALPYSAHAHPPALHSFANASGGRPLAPDGRKGGAEEQTVQTWPSVLRTAPPRRFRTPSRPVSPAVCRSGTFTPYACIVQSAGAVRRAVSGAPTTSPRQLPAWAGPSCSTRTWCPGRVPPESASHRSRPAGRGSAVCAYI